MFIKLYYNKYLYNLSLREKHIFMCSGRMKVNRKGPMKCYEHFSRCVMSRENNVSLNKAYTDITYPHNIYTLLDISKCAVCPIIRLLFTHKYRFNVCVSKSHLIRNAWERFRERKTNRQSALITQCQNVLEKAHTQTPVSQ
jgi:hypothetical protein